MRSSVIASLVCALLTAQVGSAFAADAATSNSPYSRSNSGWHFYEPPKKKPQKPIEEPVAPSLPQLPPSVEPSKPAGPAPLSAEWIKQSLPRYQMMALDDPSPRNVELVAYLERLSIDKAERYAQARQRVVVSNPALDEFARSPLTGVQRDAADTRMSVAKQAAIAQIAQRAGLWYFFSSTCPYCAKQDPILDRFQARTGVSILPISLDGGPLASRASKQYVVNQGQAQQLGVMTTPTLVVADTATGKLMNLAAGLRTISEIEERLLQVGKTEGWISEAQYDEAVRGEQRMFLTDGLNNLQALEDNPDALLGALREATYNGGSTPWVVRPQTTQGQ